MFTSPQTRRFLGGPLALAGRVVAERSEEARVGLERLASLGLPIVRVPESDRPTDAIEAALAVEAASGKSA